MANITNITELVEALKAIAEAAKDMVPYAREAEGLVYYGNFVRAIDRAEAAIKLAKED